MALTVTLSGADDVKRAIRQLAQIAPDKLRAAVGESMLNIQTAAREKAPVDTGFLRASIVLEFVTSAGAEQFVTGQVVCNSKYGMYVEFGTRPHFPPVAPLKDWARRHGLPEGVGFLIARKIARIGTPAHPFFFPAAIGERPNFENNVRQALLEAIRSVKTTS